MNENKKRLEKELSYLLKDEVLKEINTYEEILQGDNVNIKDIAREIYTKRGIDYKKIQGNNILDNVNEMAELLKIKDKEIKKKMIIELIFDLLILILMKIPFDLIRDIGYEYLDVLSVNSMYFTLWNLLFLIVYTIVFVCGAILFIRNFNKKFKISSN